MDPLSDLLRVIRLDGAFFFSVEAVAPWSIAAVAASELSPRILPGSEHLISYHILTEGRAFGGLLGEEQVELLPGDVIVFPHGDPQCGFVANVTRVSWHPANLQLRNIALSCQSELVNRFVIQSRSVRLR